MVQRREREGGAATSKPGTVAMETEQGGQDPAPRFFPRTGEIALLARQRVSARTTSPRGRRASPWVSEAPRAPRAAGNCSPLDKRL